MPKIKNVLCWPTHTIILVATSDDERHEGGHLFENAIQVYPPTPCASASAAATTVVCDEAPAGLCLDDPLCIDSDNINLDEISLDVPTELPWVSNVGELDDIIDEFGF